MVMWSKYFIVDRFSRCKFQNNKLDTNHVYINLDKDNIYRKMTSEYFLSTISKRQEVFLIQEFINRLVKGAKIFRI
ncbi:MAG: hypothetical protein K2I49_03065 [Ureaplasma sp.]|nr:hypothetical protein [Ureaplasma sp.]